MKLDAMIDARLNAEPEGKCYWWEGKWHSNKEMLSLIDATTKTLSEAGFGEGQRLTVLSPNCPMVIAIAAACWRLGGSVNPLNVKAGVPSLIGTLKLIEPFAVVVSEDIHKAAGEMLDSEGYVSVVCPPEGPLPAFKGKPATPEDKELALIFATSGTTGTPKAVPLTHLNLMTNIDDTRYAFGEPLCKGDVFLNVLPNFHAFGFTACTLLPIYAECGQVILPSFLPPLKTLKAVVEAPVTIMMVVPAMLTYMMAAIERGGPKPQHLKMVRTGGDSFGEDLNARLKKVFGLENLQGYGLTETSPTIAIVRNDKDNKQGSAGEFYRSIEWQLRPEPGKRSAKGEGVLWVRGPSVTKGYFHDPEMTAERFDKDGWFNTGDYVRVDDDGYLFILDRVTDIIIVGGFNVYPQEVERVLNAHPQVQSSIVVGMPHSASGEVPKAFILRKDDAETTELEIVRYCKEHLAHYKVPRKVEFVNDWPLSGTGKIMRRVLKEREKSKPHS